MGINKATIPSSLASSLAAMFLFMSPAAQAGNESRFNFIPTGDADTIGPSIDICSKKIPHTALQAFCNSVQQIKDEEIAKTHECHEGDKERFLQCYSESRSRTLQATGEALTKEFGRSGLTVYISGDDKIPSTIHLKQDANGNANTYLTICGQNTLHVSGSVTQKFCAAIDSLKDELTVEANKCSDELDRKLLMFSEKATLPKVPELAQMARENFAQFSACLGKLPDLGSNVSKMITGQLGIKGFRVLITSTGPTKRP